MFPELFRKLFFEILRLFEFADLVFTVFAFQRIVGPLPELLRMFEQRDLPTQHQHNAGKEQAPGEEVADKQHRREHHKIAPVEDAAVDTAAVLDKIILERAPDDHADQVADIIKHRQQNQLFRLNDVHDIQRAKDRVDTQPDQQHPDRR